MILTADQNGKVYKSLSDEDLAVPEYPVQTCVVVYLWNSSSRAKIISVVQPYTESALLFKLQVCKYTQKRYKYTNTQIHKNRNTQIQFQHKVNIISVFQP